MSYEVVKITVDNWGDERENPVWCLVVEDSATTRTLCAGEAFGIGDSSAEYVTKEGKRGSITCPDCKAKIKWFKSIQL